MKRLSHSLTHMYVQCIYLLPRRQEQEQHVTPGHCWKQNSLNNDYDYTPCIPFSVLMLYYLGAVERESLIALSLLNVEPQYIGERKRGLIALILLSCENRHCCGVS